MQMAEWIEKYRQLSERERIMVLAAVAVVIYFLFDSLVWQPLAKASEEGVTRSGELLQQEQQLQAELSVYQNLLRNDPNAAKQQQIQSLEEQVQSLDEKLAQTSAGLVPAGELPGLLQQVLRRSSRLQLRSLATMPVEIVPLESTTLSPSENSSDDEDAGSGVYRHGVELVLSGRFDAVQSYLAELEQLPWKLYWGSLDYRVVSYPDAEVSIRVYTMSLDRGVFDG